MTGTTQNGADHPRPATAFTAEFSHNRSDFAQVRKTCKCTMWTILDMLRGSQGTADYLCSIWWTDMDRNERKQATRLKAFGELRPEFCRRRITDFVERVRQPGIWTKTLKRN